MHNVFVSMEAVFVVYQVPSKIGICKLRIPLNDKTGHGPGDWIPPFEGTEQWLRLKPIFYCDAKTLALGPCVSLDPQHEILHWEYQHVDIKKR